MQQGANSATPPAKKAAMMLPVVSRSAPTTQCPTDAAPKPASSAAADARAASSRASFLRGRRPELKYAPSTSTSGFMAGRCRSTRLRPSAVSSGTTRTSWARRSDTSPSSCTPAEPIDVRSRSDEDFSARPRGTSCSDRDARGTVQLGADPLVRLKIDRPGRKASVENREGIVGPRGEETGDSPHDQTDDEDPQGDHRDPATGTRLRAPHAHSRLPAVATGTPAAPATTLRPRHQQLTHER